VIRHVVRTVAYALLVAGMASPLAAQNGTIRGSISDSSGSPLANASISVDGINLRTTSGAQGTYELRGVPSGRQTLRVRLIGYKAESAPVTVVATDAVRQDFTLGRNPVQLAPIDVVVGSRARHTAAEELAVPVDVYTAQDIQEQGTTETSRVLAALAPSVNFPNQTVTDATDIVRPFTLRGLSPDHTLVLVNGWRRHQTALLNTFPLGSPAGSSGVDLNAIPTSAIERIEVLRDGASSQYGSDAIAGVVNIVMKEGDFTPFVNGSAGQYMTGKYTDDGTTADVNGGVGFKLGRGSLGLFGQFMNRNATNRAFPDGTLQDLAGVTDVVDTVTGQIIQKRNGVPQPVNHLGDGLERDLLSFANLRMPLNVAGSTELYAFGGFSNRVGTGNGYYRKPLNNRNWPEIYPNGFLPEFRPNVNDYSAAGGVRGTIAGWSADLGGSYGRNTFDYRLRNTLNPSLGPCLETACAPGADAVLGTADDPGIPNQLSFDAGSLKRGEFLVGVNLAKPISLGLPNPVSVALGAVYRRETYEIVAGETASWINGGHLAQDSATPEPTGLAPAGSSVFSGFSPSDASNNSRNNVGVYLDLESNLTRQVLLNIAGRYEHYSDFGSRVTGKTALRVQPTKQLVFRAAASTGFRAPGLAQSWFSHVTTNFIAGSLVEVGNFPVTNRASRIFGAQPLRDETSVNLSGGVVFSPMDNFTVTVDVFHIKINHRILLGATYDAGDTVVARILADSGLTTIGGVQFPTNALDTKTDGIDLTGNLRLPTGNGTLDLNAGVNYTKNKIARVGGLPPILQGTGTSFTGALDLLTTLAITKERPDWRGTLTATWSLGRFHALGRGSYYGSGQSAEFGGVVGETFEAKTLFDAEVGYRFNQVNLSIGARNLFDVYPSRMLDLDNNNSWTFPWAVASPFGYNGRYIYARTEVQLTR
jgi:iron complex outermembrane recepter protein